MLFVHGFHSCSVGLGLPVYLTFKAIEKKDHNEQQRWLTYWAGCNFHSISFSLLSYFSSNWNINYLLATKYSMISYIPQWPNGRLKKWLLINNCFVKLFHRCFKSLLKASFVSFLFINFDLLACKFEQIFVTMWGL